MKLSVSQLLLLGSGSITAALPHRDSPRQRLLNGLDLPTKYLKESSSSSGSSGTPYTPEHRDPYDHAVDPVTEDLDPLPWRNGLGASVLGPWNPERSRQSPDLVRPPSTDHGQIANMRWSFADSHIRIEVRSWELLPGLLIPGWKTDTYYRKAAGPVRLPFVSSPPALSSLVST
jgi:hypothetical protein